jgi:stage IV sporulation protein FB
MFLRQLHKKTRTKIKLTIHPLFFILIVLLFPAGYLYPFLLVFSSVFLHEAGHVGATLLLGGRIYSIRILPVGMNAVVDDSCIGRESRLLVYAAGPFINLVLCFAGFWLYSVHLLRQDLFSSVLSANLGLLIFNLLPILPLDGGRILRELLTAHVGAFTADRHVRMISCLLALFVIAAGIVQWFYHMKNGSLVLIGLYVFFVLKSEEREAVLMNMKNIFFRRARLQQKGMYPARDIVVLKSVHLGEVLKTLDYDRFHLIHILDEELQLVCTITEQEVINALLRYPAEMTFGGYLQARA